MPNWWCNDNEEGHPAALRKICQSSIRATDLTRASANAIQAIEMSLVSAQKAESASGEGFVILAPEVTKAVERL